MPRTDFLFPSFTKGLVNGMANDTAPIEGLKKCRNVDFGKAPMGGITLRPPTVMRPNCTLANELNSAFKILHPRWLFRFRGYENDNWPYVLVGRQGAVLMNPALTDISDIINFDDDMYTDSRWAVFDENRVYFLGYNNFPTVMEKDGGNLTIRPMGVKATWDMALAAGGNLDSSAVYHYQVITVDEYGNRSSPYSAADPYISITTDSTNKQVVLSGISSGGSGDKKYIYRTLGDASTYTPDTNPMVFYLVTTIHDNQDTYSDTMSDDDLSGKSILQDVESYPPQDLVYAAVHNGVMWGFRENESILRYTNRFGYEQWPVTNAIPIGDPDYLTAIISVGDHLLIFKKNKVYAFWGSNIHNFDYREVSNIFGTSYIDTIKSVGGNQAIFLDTQRRVIMYNGGNFTEISKPIKIPYPAWYTATLYQDYYILWMYLPSNVDPEFDDTIPLPIVQYFPKHEWFRQGEDPDGGGGTWPPDHPGGGGGGGDPPDEPDDPGWDPYDDVEFEWEQLPGIGPTEPPKGPRESMPPPGWYPPYRSATVAALAYHIPTGAWSLWNDIQMLVPEKPDRSADNFVYWNGICPEILGKAASEDYAQYPEFVAHSIDTDCGIASQEKSFKEIEIYLEYISSQTFNGAVGQLEIFIDEATKPSWQQTITYNTDNPQKRWRYRIPSGKNGTRASIKFIGNQNMNRFSLMGGRLWWEPRGTPRRNA